MIFHIRATDNKKYIFALRYNAYSYGKLTYETNTYKMMQDKFQNNSFTLINHKKLISLPAGVLCTKQKTTLQHMR